MKNTSKILNLLVAMLISIIVTAQSTGYMSPTAAVAPNNWTNPTNGFVSDSLWATAPHTSGCNCPYVYLSWDAGVNYTSFVLLGPYLYTDSWKVAGSDTDHWGHIWVDTQFYNSNFRLKFANSSTLITQGYGNFNFNIPAGATIDGIEVNVQFHGDSTFTTDYLNALEVNVFYTAATGISSEPSLINKIHVFPNPAHDMLTLKTSDVSELSYSLLSMDGKIIVEKNIGTINTSFSKEIMLNDIPSGIYILRLTSNEGIEYRKIAIQ